MVFTESAVRGTSFKSGFQEHAHAIYNMSLIIVSVCSKIHIVSISAFYLLHLNLTF